MPKQNETEDRPMAPGALLAVGRFYRDSRGVYTAVLRRDGPCAIVERAGCGFRGAETVHRDDLAALSPPEGNTWEISKEEYDAKRAEEQLPRLLAPGERLEVGKFYEDAHGDLWAPTHERRRGLVAVEHTHGRSRRSAIHNIPRESLVAGGTSELTSIPETLWEISEETYQDAGRRSALPRLMRAGERMEIGKFYAKINTYYWAPLREDDEGRIVLEYAVCLPGRKRRIQVRSMRTKLLTTAEKTGIQEISAEQYRDAVGRLPRKDEGLTQTARVLPGSANTRPLPRGEALAVGGFYQDSYDNFWHVRPPPGGGQGMLALDRWGAVLGDTGGKRHLSTTFLTQEFVPPDQEGHPRRRIVWEISEKSYREAVVASEEPTRLCRRLENGERLEIGKFYKGTRSFWAPRSPDVPGKGNGLIRVDCVQKRRGRVETVTMLADQLRVDRNDDSTKCVWEISEEEYAAAVGHQDEPREPEGKVEIAAGPLTCCSCGDPIVGVNRWVGLYDDGLSVADVLRKKEPNELEDPMTTVFDGCVACLERVLGNDPVALALLKAWVKGR